MPQPLTLVSHTLCPYVQRAAIVLAEKDYPYDRLYIDLANKPEWFKGVSPLGKVPLLKVGDTAYLFESSPILEYLDETIGTPFHPNDPVERARHRAYIEFSSQILNGIGSLYTAADRIAFQSAEDQLRSRFAHLDTTLEPDTATFSGHGFSLVDAAFAPVFRYFDVFEEFLPATVLTSFDTLQHWRTELSSRPSVRSAVSESYGAELKQFLRKRNSWMSLLLAASETQTAVAE